MALAERALGGLAHGREGRHENSIERLALGEFGAESRRPGAQLRHRKASRNSGFERIDRGDLRP